jgi:hypothetical protein
MIVIATYNDISYLNNLLDGLNTTENLDENVLIVCTDDRQSEMVDYINTLPQNNNYNFNILVDVTPYQGYDSGAYIYAFKNYIDDYYIFLQDSITIKSSEWLNLFKEVREENTINPILEFSLSWDNHEQLMWVENKMGLYFNKPNVGIFGPIFQASRKSLNKIDGLYNLNNFIPSHKIIGQQGMERGWAYLAVNSGIMINSIDGPYYGESTFQSRCFNKIYLKRN